MVRFAVESTGCHTTVEKREREGRKREREMIKMGRKGERGRGDGNKNDGWRGEKESYDRVAKRLAYLRMFEIFQ